MAKSKNLLGKPKGKLKVVTLRLYEDDVEDAKDYFPAVGYNVVIRDLFRVFMSKARAKRVEEIENIDELRDIDLGAVDTVGRGASGGGANPDPEGTL